MKPCYRFKKYNMILTRFGCEDCSRLIRSHSGSRIVRSFFNYQSWLQAELLALLPGSFRLLGGRFGHRWHHCSTRKSISTVRVCCGGRGRNPISVSAYFLHFRFSSSWLSIHNNFSTSATLHCFSFGSLSNHPDTQRLPNTR